MKITKNETCKELGECTHRKCSDWENKKGLSNEVMFLAEIAKKKGEEVPACAKALGSDRVCCN